MTITAQAHITPSKPSHHQATPLRFIELAAEGLADPCCICVSHAPNPHGYFYKGWSIDGKYTLEAFHRFILRAHLGWEEWPDGFEADHLCGVRPCSQPSHLRPLARSDHRRITNAARYSERNEAARCHWLASGCSGNELARLFGVSLSTGRRWVREWKAEASAQ